MKLRRTCATPRPPFSPSMEPDDGVTPASLCDTVSALRETGGNAGGPCDHGAAPRGDAAAFHLTDRWADTHSLLLRASPRYAVESAL